MFNLEKITKSHQQTPEEYTEKLKEYLGHSLLSVILFGSAATGDHHAGKSDYNILVIARQWGILELNLLSKATQGWMRDGNPPPLTFTIERMQVSADCFPIEMLDIKQSYVVLHGADPVKELKVLPVHLRLMTGREIKSLRIKLREHFICARGEPEKVAKIMINTLSSSLVLFRAALRLYTSAVPMKKTEALTALSEHIKGLDVELFQTIHKLKHDQLKTSQVNSLQLFERYLESLKCVDEAIDEGARKN